MPPIACWTRKNRAMWVWGSIVIIGDFSRDFSPFFFWDWILVGFALKFNLQECIPTLARVVIRGHCGDDHHVQKNLGYEWHGFGWHKKIQRLGWGLKFWSISFWVFYKERPIMSIEKLGIQNNISWSSLILFTFLFIHLSHNIEVVLDLHSIHFMINKIWL